MSDDLKSQFSGFAERLVAVDPLPADRKSELQRELNAMFEKKLTLFPRIIIAVVSLFALASTTLCGYLAVTEPELPEAARIGLSVGTFFGLAWAVVGIRMLRRGVIDLKRDNRITANMVWSFTVLMVVFFLITGMSIDDRLLGVMMIAQSLAFLIGAAVVLVTQRIEQSELATRERLLQIELLIADLTERQKHS